MNLLNRMCAGMTTIQDAVAVRRLLELIMENEAALPQELVGIASELLKDQLMGYIDRSDD